MVGVAGKSKACHNCKTRRVKCGFERPHCLQCEKARLKCRGYGRRSLFVNRTLTNPDTTATEAIAAARLSQVLGPDHGSEAVVADYRNLTALWTSGTYSTADFRNSAYRILSQLYLPRKGLSDNSDGIGVYSWVAAVCQCEETSAILDLSLLAFCASQLFITRYGNITLDHALNFYSDGLSRLSKALQYVDSTTLTGLLASIVVLATCELFISPSNAGWRAHSQGMAELLRFRVDFPHSAASRRRWTQLCARAKVISVLTGMMVQRQILVDTAQWRDLIIDDAHDDPLDALLDIMTDLLRLFDSSDSPDESITALSRTLQRAYDWESTFRVRQAGSIYTFVPSQLCNPADEGYDEKLYPLVLDFRSFLVSSCLNVCWTAMLQTLTMIIRLSHDSRESRSIESVWCFLDKKIFKNATPDAAIKVEANRRAAMLCQCVEYTHREELGSLGPQGMTYAKTMLSRYYEQAKKPRELAWVLNIPNMTTREGGKFRIQLRQFHA